MCGIFGFITTEETKGQTARSRFISQSAIAGSLRGMDSAGMIFVPHDPRDNGADWIKQVGTGVDLLETKMAGERLEPSKVGTYRAVVGHNRAATQGAVNVDNAHPFVDGPITLVHNGTLHYTQDMPVSMYQAPKKKKIEVDSHLIAHNLALHDRKEVLESLEGAFALVWHDARTDCVYIARNSQRPLHFMKAKCENTLLFASEADMLWWIAGRNNFSRDTIYSLDPGVLLEFSPGNLVPKVERFNLYKPQSYGTWSSYSGGGGASTSSGKGVAAEPKPEVTAAGVTKKSRALLAELGIEPKTLLDFSADSVVQARQGYCLVNGWVYIPVGSGQTEAYQTIVTGLDRKFAHNHKRQEWQVRPIGVTYAGLKDEEVPVLLCRLVRVLPLTSTGSGAVTDMYRGPNGSWIDKVEWFSATAGGCVQCGQVLNLADAESLTWVNGNDPKPMCKGCTEVWRSDVEFMGRMC